MAKFSNEPFNVFTALETLSTAFTDSLRGFLGASLVPGESAPSDRENVERSTNSLVSEIDNILIELSNSNERIAKDQGMIDSLKAETKDMLAELKAAVS